MAETKPKATGSLRTPKPKKLGLSVPPALRLPHEDLIAPEEIDKDKKEISPTMTSHSSLTSQTSHSRPNEEPPSQVQNEPVSVAPQRDYAKVANSISRQAVPAGLFTGKSKQLYDCLYSLTRGAVVPSRTVRISRPKLMEKAHIGSRVTFDANIERLITVGLINVRQIVGEHEGNEYTIHLPEEARLTMTSQTSLTSLTSPAQNLDRLVRLETSQTSHTLNPIDSNSYVMPKTSFKTIGKNFDDDAALAGLTATLSQVTKEITGRELSATESDRWREVAEVLAVELKIAAARTTVSSVPAFLAEHLRRRLWKIDKKQARAEGRELPDEAVGQTQSVDASKCPDCGGSGWWYPEGEAKGVAKCRHEKLTTES